MKAVTKRGIIGKVLSAKSFDLKVLGLNFFLFLFTLSSMAVSIIITLEAVSIVNMDNQTSTISSIFPSILLIAVTLVGLIVITKYLIDGLKKIFLGESIEK